MGSGSLNSPQEGSGSTSPASPLPKYHNDDEVRAALGALSDDDIKYLVGFARWRILGIRGKADEADETDLLSIALSQTFKMKRKWRRGVKLRNHIIFCMRSIANRRFKKGDQNTQLSPEHPGPPFMPERGLDAKMSVERLREALADDSIALQVLETINDGLSPQKAQKLLKISSKVYQAARKRIRRRAEKLFGL
jgi:hypothetical protein